MRPPGYAVVRRAAVIDLRGDCQRALAAPLSSSFVERSGNVDVITANASAAAVGPTSAVATSPRRLRREDGLVGTVGWSHVERAYDGLSAGVEVSGLADAPGGMVAKVLPLSRYAVFREQQRGQIGGPEGYAYTTWLPQSGCRFNDEVAGDLEVYSTGTAGDPTAECDIYIPILPGHEGER